MATAENLQTLSATAGAQVRIYRFVQLQTDGKYDEVGSAEARADGVAAEAAAADGDLFAMAPCSQPAIAKVEAGEAIAVGDLISSDNQGRAKTAAAAGSGRYSLGVAKTACSNAGEIVEVQLHMSANQA